MTKPANERWRVDGYLKLLLRVKQYVGLAPIRFESNHLGTYVRLSKVHYYYGLFVVTLLYVLTLLTICCAIYFSKRKLEGPEDTVSIRLCNHFLSMSPLIFGVFNGQKRIKSLLNCSVKIQKIKNVENNDVSVPKYLMMTVFFCNLLIITTKIQMRRELYNMLYIACRVLIFGLSLLLQLSFSYVAEVINTSFQDINKRLEDIVCQMQQEGTTVPHCRLQVAHKILRVHNSFTATTNVAQELNDDENLLLVLHVVAFIMQFISSINNLLYIIGVKRKDTVISQRNLDIGTMYFAGWISYEIVKVLSLVEASHEHQEQLKRTKILVAQIMTHVTSESDLILDAITNFYNHLLLNNFSYSTMGFFDLERGVISKIIGVVIAVIVLIT